MPDQDHARNEEIRRQHDLLWRERWTRLPLTVFATMLSAMFLPVWISLLCAALNVACELGAMHYMRALNPRRHPKRYAAVAACTFGMEFFFVLPPVLIWQSDADYAQVFAVAVTCATLMHLVGERSIHLPFGYFGLAGVGLPALIGNAVYWTDKGDYLGLMISSKAAAVALIYSLITMQSNNRLHSMSARDRVAAQDSNRAKSRFLAQMSHELRTPLNAILGMGHAELRRNRDALSQSRLSVLIASAEGLSTILDDILDMSAVEAGRLPIRPRNVIISDEIEAALVLFQPGIVEAGLKLTHDIGPDLNQNGMLDPQRLRQCLSNLLSNAVKNTVHGGIHVCAKAMQDDGATILRIVVSDTGPGIPAHLHSTLFEPFTARQNARAGTESNGLGLSISRVMARQIGGDIVLLPNAPTETGARFLLTLRVGAVIAPDQPAAPPPARHDDGETNSATAGLRVLVIDDIATNRLVASTYLRMLGATMIEAESGAKALEILARERPDLVLLDMNMPEMNGLQTLEKIRALPDGAGKLPVIAMTADALEDQRTLYLSSGVDGYLAKPVNPARIEAEIKAVLEKSGAVSSH